MSELQREIDLTIVDAPKDYEVRIMRSSLNSMLRTAMMGGAELVMRQAEKSKFPLIQGRVSIDVVEYERLKRFAGEK